VEPDDPQAMEEALARLLEDEPLRRQLALSGAEHVRRALDWPVICAQYESLLQESLAP
jgi:glycosyltransferase involved in cell wall biosynthesis